jgi:hypothetical protein
MPLRSLYNFRRSSTVFTIALRQHDRIKAKLLCKFPYFICSVHKQRNTFRALPPYMPNFLKKIRSLGASREMYCRSAVQNTNAQILLAAKLLMRNHHKLCKTYRLLRVGCLFFYLFAATLLSGRRKQGRQPLSFLLPLWRGTCRCRR